MCLESPNQDQEKLKLDLGKTLLESGIERFDHGKTYLITPWKNLCILRPDLGIIRSWEKGGKTVSNLGKPVKSLLGRSLYCGGSVTKMVRHRLHILFSPPT